MTSYSHPFLCLWCERLHNREGGPMPTDIVCDAFPGGVPDDILDNNVDHRQPVDGDHGLQFVPVRGVTADGFNEMLGR